MTKRNSIFQTWYRLALACLCLAVTSSTLHAAYMTDYVGNTRTKSADGAVDMTANWAVLSRDDNPTPGDVFGTGIANFDQLAHSLVDTDAKYLYLYQIVNDGPMTTSFENVYLGSDPEVMTSMSTWNLVLSDSSGVVSLTNQFGVDGADFEVEAPANIGVDSPSVASPLTSLRPVSLDIFSGQLRGSYLPDLFSWETSYLIGYTSDFPPAFPPELNAPPTFAAGIIPNAVPEPSTCVLALASLIALLKRNRPSELT